MNEDDLYNKLKENNIAINQLFEDYLIAICKLNFVGLFCPTVSQRERDKKMCDILLSLAYNEGE